MGEGRERRGEGGVRGRERSGGRGREDMRRAGMGKGKGGGESRPHGDL